MISKLDNCLFVHIPKVAGQSIESVFLTRAGLQWSQREAFLLKPNTNPEFGPPRLAHLMAKEYVELGYVTEQTFSQLYRFSFVRNPWQRILSEYLYRGYSCSFKQFLLKQFPKPNSDNYTTGEDLYRHVMPQAEFVCDGQGRLLVDFVGRFENIAADFARVSKVITGVELVLPHKNKTKSNFLDLLKQKPRHYTEYYCNKTQKFVENYYAQDIELFDYQFGS